ncbi:MAG: integrase zinc binding domain-containing protein [Sedimenticola sp.]
MEILSCDVSSGASSAVPDAPSNWGFSNKDLIDEQAKDNDLQVLLEWLNNYAVPGQDTLFLSSPVDKLYWLNKELFTLIDGVLFRNQPDSDETDLVLPSSLRKVAFEWNHDIPSAGHQWVARTKARMKEKFVWYQMGQDISKYVTTCTVCNQNIFFNK